VAPFSVRPLPGAPMSMPLRWPEVKTGLTNERFTIRNAIERLEKLGDPLHEVIEAAPDLGGVLERLMARTQAGATSRKKK